MSRESNDRVYFDFFHYSTTIFRTEPAFRTLCSQFNSSSNHFQKKMNRNTCTTPDRNSMHLLFSVLLKNYFSYWREKIGEIISLANSIFFFSWIAMNFIKILYGEEKRQCVVMIGHDTELSFVYYNVNRKFIFSHFLY